MLNNVKQGRTETVTKGILSLSNKEDLDRTEVDNLYFLHVESLDDKVHQSIPRISPASFLNSTSSSPSAPESAHESQIEK